MNWRLSCVGLVMTLIRIKVYGTDQIPELYHFDTDSEAMTWLIQNTDGAIKEITVMEVPPYNEV